MMTAWISKTDRLPTEADSDAQRCVLAWHIHSGAMITSYRNIEPNPYIPYWMPCPEPPADAQRLIREEFELLTDSLKG